MAAGRAAKRFGDDLIQAGDEVVVSTSKPDKYDRYLADVFVGQLRDAAGLGEPGPGSATPATTEVANGEIFLNNALLANGHAVRYDGGAKQEM